MTKGGKVNHFLPYGRQSIDQQDIDAVADVLRGDCLTTGPVVEQFEQAFATQAGASHTVVCSSGTAALHLALAAVGVGKGDSVIVPSITFIATANVVNLLGATVILCDVDPNTGIMTTEALKAAYRRAELPVKAIVPVLMNGNAGNISDLITIAQSQDCYVVIDGCHAVGSQYDNGNGLKIVGCDEDKVLTAFSFHPVKTIAMGEGGAVTTGCSKMAGHMKSLRHHGVVRDCFTGSLTEDHQAPWYHEFHESAYNYRASDIHCALGLSQLSKLPAFIAKRSDLMDRYHQNLKGCGAISMIMDYAVGKPAWHLMVVQVDWAAAGISRIELVKALASHNIGTQVHYIPLHRQPVLNAEACNAGIENLSGADNYYKSVLSLPLYPNMELCDVDYVCEKLQALIS